MALCLIIHKLYCLWSENVATIKSGADNMIIMHLNWHFEIPLRYWEQLSSELMRLALKLSCNLILVKFNQNQHSNITLTVFQLFWSRKYRICGEALEAHSQDQVCQKLLFHTVLCKFELAWNLPKSNWNGFFFIRLKQHFFSCVTVKMECCLLNETLQQCRIGRDDLAAHLVVWFPDTFPNISKRTH